jgi:hypothetical protein
MPCKFLGTKGGGQDSPLQALPEFLEKSKFEKGISPNIN